VFISLGKQTKDKCQRFALALIFLSKPCIAISLYQSSELHRFVSPPKAGKQTYVTRLLEKRYKMNTNIKKCKEWQN